MSPERSKILDRIRKLFAMQESAGDIGNEHEAAAFAAKVAEMMNQHNIDKSELTPEELSSQKVDRVTVYPRDMGMKSSRKRCSWMENLAAMLTDLHQCKFAIMSGSNVIFFYGTEDNLEVVVALYTFLAPLLEKMSMKAYDRHYAVCYAENRTYDARGYRGSWLIGAVAGIGEKIREQQAFAKTTGGMSLIRLTNQLVDDHMRKMFRGRSADALSNKGGNFAGRRDGRVEGKSLNVNPLI